MPLEISNNSNHSSFNNGTVIFEQDNKIKKTDDISLKDNIDESGSINKKIGSGENAKNSFVYIVITWSFTLGCIVTGILSIFEVIKMIRESREIDLMKFINCIKDSWSIFTPLITLALGYAFGKSKN